MGDAEGRDVAVVWDPPGMQVGNFHSSTIGEGFSLNCDTLIVDPALFLLSLDMTSDLCQKSKPQFKVLPSRDSRIAKNQHPDNSHFPIKSARSFPPVW